MFKIVNKSCFEKFARVGVRNFYNSGVNFAGHSKWANIKHIKASKDGQKAAMFTKYARQIRLAMQEGGSNNPQINTGLRQIIDEAVKKNMPMASIQNQLKKYNANSAQLKKHYFEIKSFNKIFIICEVFTENFPSIKMSTSTFLKKNR
jgi:translational activator of cytochrome c oxidase 1